MQGVGSCPAWPPPKWAAGRRWCLSVMYVVNILEIAAPSILYFQNITNNTKTFLKTHTPHMPISYVCLIHNPPMLHIDTTTETALNDTCVYPNDTRRNSDSTPIEVDRISRRIISITPDGADHYRINSTFRYLIPFVWHHSRREQIRCRASDRYIFLSNDFSIILILCIEPWAL
jgi:hypothetical protein